VDLVSGVISQLEPSLVEDHEEAAPTKHLAKPPLLKNPYPAWHGRAAWLSAVASSLMWHGDAFAYRGPEVQDYRGYPLSLPLIDASYVTFDRGVYKVNQTEVPASDILHMVVSPKAGYVMGRGILDRYQTELQILQATEQAQFVLMSEGRPVGILSSNLDLSPTELAEAKTSFLSAMQTSGVAALSNATYAGIQWNAQDLAMVPAREFNLRMASDIVGVPPYLLGVPSESRVYSNMETEWANFIRVTLGRYLVAIEAALSTCFPNGKVVKFDTTQLLRADSAARWSLYEKAINLGVATAEEVRVLEGWPESPEATTVDVPEPDGDEDQPPNEEETQ
jgi:HK97 family phage portal protein